MTLRTDIAQEVLPGGDPDRTANEMVDQVPLTDQFRQKSRLADTPARQARTGSLSPESVVIQKRAPKAVSPKPAAAERNSSVPLTPCSQLRAVKSKAQPSHRLPGDVDF